MNEEQRQQRQLKRAVKRAGNKRRRQQLQRELNANPEEAAFSQFDFGRDSSAPLNGMDQDSTRRRKTRRKEEPHS
jgi:hypothetical protein